MAPSHHMQVEEALAATVFVQSEERLPSRAHRGEMGTPHSWIPTGLWCEVGVELCSESRPRASGYVET